MVETLKTEQELLLEKIAKARDRGDAGTYKNLITALRDISRLIHDEEHMNRTTIALGDIGITTKDMNGEYKKMSEVLNDISEVFRDLCKDMKKTISKTISG